MSILEYSRQTSSHHTTPKYSLHSAREIVRKHPGSLRVKVIDVRAQCRQHRPQALGPPTGSKRIAKQRLRCMKIRIDSIWVLTLDQSDAMLSGV